MEIIPWSLFIKHLKDNYEFSVLQQADTTVVLVIYTFTAAF